MVLATDLNAQPDKPSPAKSEQGNGNGNKDEQDKVQKEIDAWTKKLHSPDAKLREDAVVNLISMNNPRAHEPLIRALDRAADGKAAHLPVAELIFTELRQSLANHRHPVFGVGSARDSMRRSYMRPVVQLYLPMLDGKTHSLQEAAGACLRQLPTTERIDGARLLLGAANPKLRQATLLALGDSWDLGMAPFLAGYLEDPALAGAATRALKRLTFQDLRTKAEYETWWAANNGRTYMEIAIAAARDADRSISSERERNAEEIRRAYAQIVDFLVTSKQPDRWKQIQGYIFDPKLGAMQAILVKLRDRLRNGIELAGGAEASDRLTLLAALHQELARSQLPPNRYALLLEVTSHLIAPTEARERRVQEDLLRLALDHAAVEVALAGLRGLRQFPSPDNRLAVVRLARRARSRKVSNATTNNNSNRPLLAEALSTLKSAGWTAPLAADKDHGEWQEVLALLLLDTNLDGFLRQEVVKALAKADKDNDHPAGVQRELSTLAGRANEDLSLRQAALLELPQVLTDVKSADAYVTFLVNLLQDKEEEVRREAATQLKRLPYDKDRANEKRLAWQQLLLANLTIDQLLGSETNEKVFEALVDCLVRLAKENQAHSSAVFERLSRAVLAIHKENKPETAFKIPVLKQGIIIYATAKDRHAVEWVRACEALIDVQDRKSTLAILESRNVKVDTENAEIRTLYQKMRVNLALLGSEPGSASSGNGGSAIHDASGIPWGAKALRAEAIEVTAALESLAGMEPIPKEISRPEVRLLWLCCLAGTDQRQKLVKLATPWLADTDTILQGNDRVTATLLLTLTLLETKQPKEAVKWGRKLAPVGNAGGAAGTLPDDNPGLALVERIATLLLVSARETGDKDMIATVEMLARHTATNTGEKDPDHLRRQLLYLEAQSLGADGTAKSALRGQLDRLLGEDGGDVPAGLKARVERLRKELGG